MLRAPLLYDGPVTGQYRVIENEDYQNGIKISRADVAHFLIKELMDNSWVNRVIAIADP
jgi:hypothetical protein